MLAREVESGLFQKLDVRTQRLVGGRGVNSVRPESLVQRADLKNNWSLSAIRVNP
jgi:hypothetical protein